MQKNKFFLVLIYRFYLENKSNSIKIKIKIEKLWGEPASGG